MIMIVSIKYMTNLTACFPLFPTVPCRILTKFKKNPIIINITYAAITD